MSLDTLPSELVLLISGYLLPVDAACLALCSHHFMPFSPGFDGLLGKSFPGVHTRRPGKKLRIDLLTRLARDLPQYYLCYACLRLHLWRYVDLPSPKFKLRSCSDRITDKRSFFLMPAYLCQYLAYEHHSFHSVHLHFVHLHLVVRRFYFGPSFGISAESLMYTDVSFRKSSNAWLPGRESLDSHRTNLMSLEARICPDPPGLCVRIQHLAVVERQNVLQLCTENESPIRAFEHMGSIPRSTCSLCEMYFGQGRTDIGKLLREGRCSQCNTSWKLQLREIGKEDICLLLTQWKDLGPGLDPDDGRWGTWTCRSELNASEMVVDPRMRFEMQSNEPGSSSSQTLSEEDMFLRNVSLLRAQRYRTVMRQWGEGWYLQGKEDEVKDS